MSYTLEFIESTMIGRNNEALKDRAGRSEEGIKIKAQSQPVVRLTVG